MLLCHKHTQLVVSVDILHWEDHGSNPSNVAYLIGDFKLSFVCLCFFLSPELRKKVLLFV